MRLQTCLAVSLCLVLVALTSAGGDDTGKTLKDIGKPLVVHEWGTFTVLQDDAGNPVDGVNINEESLPPFVHELAWDLAPDSLEHGALLGLSQSLNRRSKGISRSYHAARMRLETPIIYLYPPQDQPERPVQVNVNFKGGWITEWYPQAKVVAPGYRPGNSRLSLGDLFSGFL